MNKHFDNYFSKHPIISHLFTGIIMLMIGVLVAEPIKLYIIKKYSKKEISYDLISNVSLSKGELYNYEINEGFQKFNLQLDDPIISNYQLLTLKISNNGVSINGPLKFRISFSDRYAKILDIKYKVNSPSNKVIKISNSIQDLEWSIDEYKKSSRLGTISWDIPGGEIAGYNIYKSRFNDIGFGKINNHLIVTNKYTVNGSPLIDDYSSYYSVQAVGVDAERTKISDAIPLLDTVPFRPFFKNVVIVDPDYDIQSVQKRSNQHIFKTLKEAMAIGEKGSVYFVYKKREEAIKRIDLLSSNDNNNIVYYLDDIEFMSGTVDLNLHNGLDEDADISFYILYKILQGREYVFSSKIDGNPDIIYTKRGSENKYNIKLDAPKNEVNSDKRYPLTPFMATSYTGKHGIYIFWTHPKDQKYRGVHIFRKTENDKIDKKNPGNEMYMGPGKQDNIICEWDGGAYARDYSMNKYYQNNEDIVMPPRKTQKVADNTRTLISPTLLKIRSDITINSYDNAVLPYYYDNSVSLSKQYTYTIFAYDDEGSYSYPVAVNAILGTQNETPYCIPADN